METNGSEVMKKEKVNIGWQYLAKLIVLRLKVPLPTTPRRSLKEATFYINSWRFLWLSKLLNLHLGSSCFCPKFPSQFRSVWMKLSMCITSKLPNTSISGELSHETESESREKLDKIRRFSGENQFTKALIVEVALMLDKLSSSSPTDLPLNPVGVRKSERWGHSEGGVRLE